MAELRIPTTELVKPLKVEELRQILGAEPRTKLRLVYYTLYGELIIAGPQFTIRSAWGWFRRPLGEVLKDCLTHGEIKEQTDDEAVIAD